MRYLCSPEEIRLERRWVIKSWLLRFLLALLYCPRQVKNIWDDILEMLPEKPNKAEIMQEYYCLETLCYCLFWRVRWSTFSFQRSIGLWNSCTSIWRHITYFRAFCGFFGNERIVILYVCFLFFSKGRADVFCSHGSAAIHTLLWCCARHMD